MDIAFKVKEKSHTIKVIAYTTTCQLMIQPKGEQSGVKAHLGSRGTPRYFADTFLIPWCQKSVDTNAYNEKMSGFYINALNNEIKRMEASKTELKNEVKKRTKNSISGDVTNAKCVNKGCSFKGLDPNNKSAVGVCTKCSKFEHFACIRMKSEYKDDIIKGNMKFYCSECFSKNPSIASSKVRPRLDSLPLLGQGYLFKVTKTVTATATSSNSEDTHNMSMAITEVLNCNICSFETNNQSDLTAHNQSEHEHNCDHCAVQAKTQDEMEQHVLQHHTVLCNICDTKTLRTEAELVIHMAACHSFPCNKCDEIFTTTTFLGNHMKSNHSISCQNCTLVFGGQSELEDHIAVHHQTPCDICNETFSDNSKLREHHKSCHEVHCNHCDAIHTSKAEKEKHVRENHNYCETCNTSFSTTNELAVHTESHGPNNASDLIETNNAIGLVDKSSNPQIRLFLCIHCEKEFKSKEDIIEHMNKDHESSPITIGLSCQICSHKVKDKNELDNHQDESHPTICKLCGKEEKSKEDLNFHIINTHTYKCDICDLVVTGEVSMEDHILDKHAAPDIDNIYRCDDCTFESKDKNDFGNYYKDNHGHEATKLAQDKFTINDENKKLLLELKEIKSNYERLESLYHDSLDEVNQVRADYEAKIIHLNENNEVLKTENNVLKEKVDILFKLGRSYINNATRSANKSVVEREESEKHSDAINDVDSIEVIEVIEGNTTNTESLKEWTKMKMRGFKRLSPAAPPIPNPNPTSSRHNDEKLEKRKRSGTEDPPPSPPSSPAPPQSASAGSPTTYERKRYCHYYANTGRCNFEEKTGKKCKFAHEQAPMCNSGISCSRPKCMFSHPKINGNDNFLGHMRPLNNMVPWQIINPWMSAPPYQFQSNFQDHLLNMRK